MNLKTNDNIGNEHQRCKGCEKTLPLDLFVINGKSYRTCNTCRIKNKESYQKKSSRYMQELPINRQLNLLSYMTFYRRFMKENLKIKRM